MRTRGYCLDIHRFLSYICTDQKKIICIFLPGWGGGGGGQTTGKGFYLSLRSILYLLVPAPRRQVALVHQVTSL